MNSTLSRAIVAVGICALVTAGMVGCAGSTPRDRAVPEAAAVSLAPHTLNDLDGTAHTLLDGSSPTVLVFWATWCRPCRRKLPELASLHAKHGDSVQFFGVLAGEEKHVNEREARNLIAKAGVRYPQLRDFDGSLARNFGVKGTPTVIVLGPDGRTRYYGHELPKSWDDLLE